MNSIFARVVASPLGIFFVLVIAAALEVYGDAFFQTALYRSAGPRKIAYFLCGAATLTLYSLFLNCSRVDFGRLLGVYVVLFFLFAQFVAWREFKQHPTPPIYAGGALIVLGGLIMSVWRS